MDDSEGRTETRYSPSWSYLDPRGYNLTSFQVTQAETPPQPSFHHTLGEKIGSSHTELNCAQGHEYILENRSPVRLPKFGEQI